LSLPNGYKIKGILALNKALNILLQLIFCKPLAGWLHSQNIKPHSLSFFFSFLKNTYCELIFEYINFNIACPKNVCTSDLIRIIF